MESVLDRKMKGGAAMELLEQCRKWNENKEYQKLIDALENISADERTPEMDSELAKAYIAIADKENGSLMKKVLRCPGLRRTSGRGRRKPGPLLPG